MGHGARTGAQKRGIQAPSKNVLQTRWIFWMAKAKDICKKKIDQRMSILAANKTGKKTFPVISHRGK
jgi:hypothetical protein